MTLRILDNDNNNGDDNDCQSQILGISKQVFKCLRTNKIFSLLFLRQ